MMNSENIKVLKTKYRAVAVIPARGGSKRIPRKNIKEFCGKPMIAYPIDIAKASTLFDQIVVSTDDDEIAEVAQELGAVVPFVRPDNLADDFTGTNAVVFHALEQLKLQGTVFDIVFCIYATNPFLQIEFLRKAYMLLDQKVADSAFTVTAFPAPIRRAWHFNSVGKFVMLWPQYRLTRTQDIEEVYHDAAQFYCAYTSIFMKEQRFDIEGVHPIILPRYLAQDIDTQEDWQRAELIFQAMKSWKTKLS